MNQLLICTLSELKNSRAIIRYFDELKDEIISFLDRDGRITCYSSVCPHLSGEVIYSETDKALRCRWHGLCFDHQGYCSNGKVRLSLRRYETILRDQDVYLIYEP
jgi:nitrite reductase/ring-hydroxylating ferredoxin subunit